MIYISFGSSGYEYQQSMWKQSFSSFGSEAISYGPSDLGYLNQYLYGSRGYGYWIWKPYLILKTLRKHSAVFYSDLDYTLLNQDRLIALLGDSKQLLIELEPFHLNKYYIKRDCYYFMGADSIEYYDLIQAEAGLQYWTNTPENINILSRILGFCMNRAIISDDPNICGLDNLTEYRGDHRHDQAIVSICKKMFNLESISVYNLVGIIGGIL
jgi:hypothetical protein